MKRKLTISMITLTLTTAIGQITTTQVETKTDQTCKIPYDSTENFLEGNVYQYIGQELYLNGKSKGRQQFGYSGFILDYNKDKYNKENVYKCGSQYNSIYGELVGKYFKVIEIIKHPKANEYKSYLKLQEKESKDIVYFEYDSRFKYDFPFIVVGYWEKRKSDNVGKQFVLRYLKGQLFDIKTGTEIEFTNGSTWKCVDLIIEEEYYILYLVFENDKGQKIVSGGNDGLLGYWEKSVADNYKSKFGSYWQTILEEKLKIGMTNEMCELSWGKPKSINETITAGKKTEQWVYPDSYLYFDNDVLTTIQAIQ